MAADTKGRGGLVGATVAGTLAQLAMVISGHWVPAVAALFAVLGMVISLLAGLLYGAWARPATAGRSAGGGVVAGGVCAFLGICVSFLLGDVTASILLFGTVSSAVTGAIGGAVGRVIGGGPRDKVA